MDSNTLVLAYVFGVGPIVAAIALYLWIVTR